MYGYNYSDLTHVSELKECFALFEQGEGQMQPADVGNALRALGQNPTEAEVAKIEEICNSEGQFTHTSHEGAAPW